MVKRRRTNICAQSQTSHTVPPVLSVKHSSATEMNGFETSVVISYISMRSDLGADGRTILKRILMKQDGEDVNCVDLAQDRDMLTS